MNSKFKITRIYPLLVILLLTISCGSKEEHSNPENKVDVDTANVDSTKISSRDIAKMKFTEYALSDIAQNKTSNWQKFNELNEKIEVLKTGDLSFFTDDKAILEGFITDLINEVPESLNNQSILVRLTVIKTTFLKLEGLASLSTAKKDDVLDIIKDVLISYNNLVFQINKKFEKESQNIIKPE